MKNTTRFALKGENAIFLNFEVTSKCTWCEPFIEKKELSWHDGWNKNGLKKQDMDNLIVDRYMRLIEPLPFEIKLELISKLFENLKTKVSIPTMNKDELINELYGSWHDVDESLIEDIYSH